MSRQPRTTRDDFECWLIDMDDAIERLLALLPSDQMRQKLDFSPPSLDTLEAWILERYSSTEAMLEQSETTIVDGLARYIGETYRMALGGHWDINLDDPQRVYFGIPILVAHESRLETEICPLSLATASANRRTRIYLRMVLENHLKIRQTHNQSH